MSNFKVLIAEDEDDIRNLIQFNLSKEGYQLLLAKDGEETIQIAKSEKPDLALLDIMMPKMDGIAVVNEMKKSDDLSNCGIIMLTAKGTEEDIVRGLESGADDYITKPFSPKILAARIKAVLRRKQNQQDENNREKQNTSKQNEVEIHQIRLNKNQRKAWVDDKEIELTYTEFQLLLLLTENPGWVFTRSQIVDNIRGENHAITDRSVDVQVVGLRKKLMEKGKLIETVRGVGYRLKELNS